MGKVIALTNSNLKGSLAEIVVIDEVHELPGFPADETGFRASPNKGSMTGSPTATDWAAPMGTLIPDQKEKKRPGLPTSKRKKKPWE